MRPNNLVGQRFGRLLVTHDGGRDKKKNILWACQCDCGSSTLAHAYDLAASKVASCGCLRREVTSRNHSTHRMRHTRAYESWAGMLARCRNNAKANWKHYGGRGVTVYGGWLSFEAFYADMGNPPDGHSLERKDNDGPYAPWNCVWATQLEQTRNTRRNVRYELGGATLIQVDAAALLGVKCGTLRAWRQKGLSDKQIEERAEWLRQKRAR